MRFRRFLQLVQAVTFSGHAVFALGLSRVIPGLAAMLTGGALWVLTSLRLSALFADRRRPRWVTLLVVEPLCCHWAACVLALPMLALLGLGILAAGGLGCAPVASGTTHLEWSSVALGCYATGLGISGWSVWVERRRLAIRRIDLIVDGLSPELDGYQVVQLSDLHIGSFDDTSHGLGWSKRANQLGADLAVVTGDLVTAGTEFYPDAAEVVGELRARDGVLVCMGNHDQWDDAQLKQELERRGATVLANSWKLIQRGNGSLVVAGVDDHWTGKGDLARTLEGRPQGVPTVLLAHDPDFVPSASEAGVELVLSGHTHGGQVGVPFLSRWLNLAALTGQRGSGLLRFGKTYSYVSAGLGTTGLPFRLAIPPEIALFTLRAPSD